MLVCETGSHTSSSAIYKRRTQNNLCYHGVCYVAVVINQTNPPYQELLIIISSSMPHRQNDHKLNYAVKLHMMKRILTNEVRLLMDTCMYVCVCVCVCVYAQSNKLFSSMQCNTHSQSQKTNCLVIKLLTHFNAKCNLHYLYIFNSHLAPSGRSLHYNNQSLGTITGQQEIPKTDIFQNELLYS